MWLRVGLLAEVQILTQLAELGWIDESIMRMYAEEFHILKNPLHENDPWYYESEITIEKSIFIILLKTCISKNT